MWLCWASDRKILMANLHLCGHVRDDDYVTDMCLDRFSIQQHYSVTCRITPRHAMFSTKRPQVQLDPPRSICNARLCGRTRASLDHDGLCVLYPPGGCFDPGYRNMPPSRVQTPHNRHGPCVLEQHVCRPARISNDRPGNDTQSAYTGRASGANQPHITNIRTRVRNIGCVMLFVN